MKKITLTINFNITEEEFESDRFKFFQDEVCKLQEDLQNTTTIKLTELTAKLEISE